jgi:short subunit dehydrogenase
MSLKDKNVVVTGGSRGLGLGLVEALVAHGARVTVVTRGADAFESVRARLLWFMAKYANGVAKQTGLGIRFQAILPMQIIGGTGVGDVGASAYARAMGIETEAFLARFGAPMPPRQFGDYLVAVLDDPQYATGFAFGLKGDTGITVLEGEAA